MIKIDSNIICKDTKIYKPESRIQLKNTWEKIRLLLWEYTITIIYTVQRIYMGGKINI